MANTATIRNANGIPATFAGSKTGQDDAPFVLSKSETKSAAAMGRMGCAPRLDRPSSVTGSCQRLTAPPSRPRVSVRSARRREAALTCSRYQSGEVDWSGKISRCGDEMMRTMLYEAAQSMMHSKNGPGSRRGPCKSPGAAG